MYSRAFDIHTNSAQSHTPSSVLIFAEFDEHLVWVRHPKRGWEVPGGKIEPGESPEQAVEREVYEEAGLRLSQLQWIAEYAYWDDNGLKRFKWVYFGQVAEASSRPRDSEIVDVRVFRPHVLPAQARLRQDVSFIMKDDVYELLWPVVQRCMAPPLTS